MKFIVDELPKDPNECPMNTIKETYIPTCRLTDDLYFECKIGEKDFECPYLRIFEAVTEEPIPGYNNSFKKIPVKLED